MKTRFKHSLTAALAVALSSFALQPALAADPAPATQPAPAAGTIAWVDQKIRDARPTESEKKFDKIGWLTDIRAARKLARETNRPLFLFTHDGRISTGRC